ncbi:hypothetical protein T03_4515 [Trichinella britovi]|uniref:Uncharacterized protein n=1 Tax=Trichinella britovi TaxID=45882 RepID=A0A0V1AHY7_TRIBR|nr:hypothetical protein T03_4515 [Trichinella britovi]
MSLITVNIHHKQKLEIRINYFRLNLYKILLTIIRKTAKHVYRKCSKNNGERRSIFFTENFFQTFLYRSMDPET